MSLRSRLGGIAVGAGIAGVLFFCNRDGTLVSHLGANLVGGVAIVMLAVVIAALAAGSRLSGGARWLAVPTLLFASSFIWRADGFILFWNAALMLLCGSIALQRSQGRLGIRTAGYFDFVGALLLSALQAIMGTRLLRRLHQDPRPTAELSKAHFATGVVTPLLKGALFAVVPIYVFGTLLESADPVFAQFVQNIFSWEVDKLAHTLLWFVVFGWAACGIVAGVALVRSAEQKVDGEPSQRRLWLFGSADICVGIALIDILFAIFVAIQFEFLFGGSRVVQSVPHLTYATYARSGFFELAWVAGLSLPLLLVAHWFLEFEEERDRRRVRWCTGVMTALLMVMIVSAFKRMGLYETIFGLTEDRVLVSAFIAAIGLAFVWFLATAWRCEPRRFALGLLVICIATIGGSRSDQHERNRSAHRCVSSCRPRDVRARRSGFDGQRSRPTDCRPHRSDAAQGSIVRRLRPTIRMGRSRDHRLAALECIRRNRTPGCIESPRGIEEDRYGWLRLQL